MRVHSNSIARIGDRVRLVFTTDPYTRLRPGTEGVVTFIDDMATVFVKWDDGSSLGMLADYDAFEILRDDR